jgi:FAD/FMN-containing dehydrogenase
MAGDCTLARAASKKMDGEKMGRQVGEELAPTIFQFDNAECGPAALAMVLAHHGRTASLDELSAACQVEQFGSRASSLLAVARDFGLAARALRLDAAAIRAQPTPLIAHWLGDHFVVVEAFPTQQVQINDPAVGRRLLGAEEFAAGYSGVALVFAPARPGPARERPPAHGGDPLVAALRAGLRGAVGWQPWQVARYRQDFSRLGQQTPRLVVKAVCEEDVVHTLRLAQLAGLPVVTRGAGHARHGQSLTEGGILLLNYLDAPVAQWRPVEGHQVEVSARSSWAALEAALNATGRATPTLPAYPDLSVGGTLSVGGYGERSLAHGAQIHHVRRLRLVLPGGVALWCSPDENQELFRYALAGLGQVGVIERVVLSTIPYPDFGEAVYHHYPTLERLVAALAYLAEQPAERLPHFAGYALRGRGYFAESRYPARPMPEMPPGALPTTARPDFRGQNVADEGMRLAADYLFDLDGLRAYLDFLSGLWQTTPLGDYADWALLLAVRSQPEAIDFPLEARPASRPPVAFLVGFYPSVSLGDERGLAFVRDIVGQTLWKCRELGGRPYLYGSHELDEASWLAFYGDAYTRLKALRAELDPRGLLNGHIL